MESIFGPSDLIHVYTRAQAIKDGVLIDITKSAEEAGFGVLVAMTQAAWADCVQWTEETDRRKAVHQDEAGRLWDVVYMAHRAARANCGAVSCEFQVYRVPVEGRGNRPRLMSLRLRVGAGDEGEPVVTISLPGED